MSTPGEILAKLVALDEELLGIFLDDRVHDVKSLEASQIANQGMEAEVQYLLDSGCTAESLQEDFFNYIVDGSE